MHTPLSPHLHTEKCQKIIEQLLQCHAERSKFAQLFGACTDLDTQMRACTKAERIDRTRVHREAAHEKQKEVAKKCQEYEKKDWREETRAKIRKMEEELKKNEKKNA